MTNESNEYVGPLCEDFWTEFINNTDLTIRPVGKISYYDQVFFDVRSKGKILANPLHCQHFTTAALAKPERRAHTWRDS